MRKTPGQGTLLRTKDGAITKVLDILEGADPPYQIRVRDPESGQWRPWREIGGRRRRAHGGEHHLHL